MASPILAIRIISDATKAARGFQQAESSTQKFERRMGTATKVAGGTLLAVGALGAKARTEASSLQQSSGAVSAAFGKQAKSIRRASRSAAGDLGLAKSEYQQMAAVLGSQLRNLGTSQDQLVPKTKSLISLGGDLAATYGGKTSDAVEALSSLMRGERDPIERYGVSIKQADINAQLLAKGQSKLTGASRKQAETEATLALLTKQTAKAQGQRRRESGTDAQAAEVASAKMKNAYASIGTAILPVTAAIATSLANVAGWVDRNHGAALAILGVIVSLAGAVFVINTAYKVYTAYTRAAAAAQALFNLQLSLNPIGIVILSVIALAALFVVLWKRSSTFRGIIKGVGAAGREAIGWVIDKAQGLANWFGKLGPAANAGKRIVVSAFKLYTKPITTIIDLIQRLIGWIRDIKWPKPPKWLSKVGGFIGGGGGDDGPHAPGGHVPPGGRGGPGGGGGFMVTTGGSSAAGATVVNVYFNGIVGDPLEAARMIRDVLLRLDTVQGKRP